MDRTGATSSVEKPASASDPAIVGGSLLLSVLGIACYAFGVADLVLYWAGIADLTGVWWSPFVAFVVGDALRRSGKGR